MGKGISLELHYSLDLLGYAHILEIKSPQQMVLWQISLRKIFWFLFYVISRHFT